MKRLLMSICLLAVMAMSMQAGRAFTEPFAVKQPDGTTLTVALYGDEHCHWTMTSDGVLVVDSKRGYFVAAIDSEGQLTATELLAHSAQQRTTAEQQACALQLKHHERFFERVQQQREQALRRAQVTGGKYFPHRDSPKSLVVLVAFKDQPFTSDDPVTQFNQYFSGETQQDLGQKENSNIVSVRKYFAQSSHGLFTPQFDVVGPITLSQNLEYYGEDYASGSADQHFGDFCNEVVALADDLVDFKNYDNNGDGEAELVCVVYAGYGQSVSGNPAETLWPKCSYRGLSTNDGVRVGYMNCSPELLSVKRETDINGIGLFVHEFSHGMGLPDVYPNNNNAKKYDNQSMEYYDLMDYGEYGRNGYAPVPYNAWEQEAMGWIDVEVLTESQRNMQMASLVAGGKAYKYGNGENKEEFIYLENMQPYNLSTGTTGYSYGHGLLAYHVAYQYDAVNIGDYPNNTGGKPRVAAVPASGLMISGYRFVPSGQNPTTSQPYTQSEYLASLRSAPFPGTGGVTKLTDEQALPNYKFYNYPAGGSQQTGYNLTNIAEDAEKGMVSFDFWKGEPTAVNAIRSQVEKESGNYYLLDGRSVGTDIRQLPKGLYIRNGKKVLR